MLGGVVVEDFFFSHAPERGQALLLLGRQLAHIKGKVLRGQARINQRRRHVGVAREKPSAKGKVPVERRLGTKPAIKGVGVGNVRGFL